MQDINDFALWFDDNSLNTIKIKFRQNGPPRPIYASRTCPLGQVLVLIAEPKILDFED